MAGPRPVAHRKENRVELEHNGRAVRMPESASATLGELVDRLCATGAESRVLSRLFLDEQEIFEEDWPAARARASSDHARVRIETRSLEEAARNTLAHARAYCEPVLTAIASVADGLRDGRRGEAMQTYTHLLDALGVLGSVLASASLTLPDMEPLRGCENELTPHLESLLEAHEADDELGIADVLEHEIAPLVRAWAERAAAAGGNEHE